MATAAKKHYHFSYVFMGFENPIYLKGKVRIKIKKGTRSLREAEEHMLKTKATVFVKERKKLVPVKTNFSWIKEMASRVDMTVYKR